MSRRAGGGIVERTWFASDNACHLNNLNFLEKLTIRVVNLKS